MGIILQTLILGKRQAIYIHQPPISWKNSKNLQPPPLSPPFSINYTLPPFFYKLSTVKINNAALCLTNNPPNPTSTCIHTISFNNLSSLNGPLHTSQRLRIVMLVVSVTFPSTRVTPRQPTRSNTVIRRDCNLFGSLVHGVTEGSRSPERALNRGSLCRGQAIRRKS